MEFLQSHWGDLASVAGLFMAIWAAMSAQSAKQAATEARDSIVRPLMVVDVQKTVGLIARIKDMHESGRWDVALDRYPDLRELLYSIEARLPDTGAQSSGYSGDSVLHRFWRRLRGIGSRTDNHIGHELPEFGNTRLVRETLVNAASQVTEIQDMVRRNMDSGLDSESVSELIGTIDDIQSLLQRLASRLSWDSS